MRTAHAAAPLLSAAIALPISNIHRKKGWNSGPKDDCSDARRCRSLFGTSLNVLHLCGGARAAVARAEFGAVRRRRMRAPQGCKAAVEGGRGGAYNHHVGDLGAEHVEEEARLE